MLLRSQINPFSFFEQACGSSFEVAGSFIKRQISNVAGVLLRLREFPSLFKNLRLFLVLFATWFLL